MTADRNVCVCVCGAAQDHHDTAGEGACSVCGEGLCGWVQLKCGILQLSHHISVVLAH